MNRKCMRMTDFSLDEGKLFSYGGKHATRRVRDDIQKLAGWESLSLDPCLQAVFRVAGNERGSE